MLSRLLANALAGQSQVLVLRGDAGIGKTALLDFLTDHADGCRLARASGVESEMEIAFASLHQICGPFLDRLDALPAPQRDALATTFGLQPSQPTNPFVVGLAVLNLLSDVAEGQPLVCVIDDAQWLDQASLQTLEFVARRLVAERIAIVFAVRETDEEAKLMGLPEQLVRGLPGSDAASLLDASMTGPLDRQIRDRILADSHGNPLALVELPREATSFEVDFGPGPRASSVSTSLVDRLEQNFLRHLQDLPQQSRQLLLLAAAEPIGDVHLLWRAAEQLGIGRDAAVPVEKAGMLELRHRVEFRHPLLRSTVSRAAPLPERREVHAALARVTDPLKDPDRRAWHRARSAVGPDEAIAAELETSADRALGRGGLAAAAAFLQAAAALTPHPARRAQRSLAAAKAKATGGAFDDATALLAVAQAGPLTAADQTKVRLLHAQIAHHSQHGNKAMPLLLSAARQLEATDPQLARETYLDALAAAMFAGRLAAGTGDGMRQVAEAMREVRQPPEPNRSDLLLQSIAVLYTDGYAAAAPGLSTIVRAFGNDELTMDEAVRFAWLAACAAADLWDDLNWGVLTRRHLDSIRGIGALAMLPVALNSRIIYDLYSGELAEADALVAESRWIEGVTGGQNTMLPYGEVCLSAMRGDSAAAEQHFRQLLDDINARGEGVGLNMVGWFQAVMFNGLGRYEDALTAARLGTASLLELGPPKWALAELVEAAVRSGNTEEATAALEKVSYFAQACGTDAALGVEAGRKALLRRGIAAEDCYREEIERLGRTTLRVELARARLRYGEWLRREDRRADARVELRQAHDELTSMGVGAFTERVRQELAATGETVRESTVQTAVELTAQESHIARLAADGLTNPEIGAALYISPRTVEWHLRKVFNKLGVTTRRQLRHVLPDYVPGAAAG